MTIYWVVTLMCLKVGYIRGQCPRRKDILLGIMLLKVRQRHFYIFYIFLFWSVKGWCSPWIGTLEPQLHQDLQVLVEWGGDRCISEQLSCSLERYCRAVRNTPRTHSSEYPSHLRAAIEILSTNP